MNCRCRNPFSLCCAHSSWPDAYCWRSNVVCAVIAFVYHSQYMYCSIKRYYAIHMYLSVFTCPFGWPIASCWPDAHCWRSKLIDSLNTVGWWREVKLHLLGPPLLQKVMSLHQYNKHDNSYVCNHSFKHGMHWKLGTHPGSKITK